jgi:hypothetical protein
MTSNFTACIIFVLACAVSCFGQSQEAKLLVSRSLEAMGGESKIRALTSIQIEGIGHTYAVEQSERSDGPFGVSYQQRKELRDLVRKRISRTAEVRPAQSSTWRTINSVIADGFAGVEAGGRQVWGNIVQVEDTKKLFALSPERILLTALEASDLRTEKETILKGVRQQVLKFTWENHPITVYLNRETYLPTAVDIIGSAPYDPFWTLWGDFTTRTYYSLWNLERGGIRYPHQSDVEKNGTIYQSFTITGLKFNEPTPDDLFKISVETKKGFTANQLTKTDDVPLGVPNNPSAEIAPGVIKVPGRWDVAYVSQPDGIVIIESPMSSGYSVKVLEDVKKRFPNKKIKAVVTTSGAPPNFGGIREYVAQNIPIYPLDLNRTIIERVLGMPHKSYPDNLERKPTKPTFKIVSAKTTIGTDSNRIELIPFRTEAGERMMMIYFPEHKLLYASDLIQPGRPSGLSNPLYLSEALDAVTREKIIVENVFGMHLGLTPWADVAKAVAAQATAGP